MNKSSLLAALASIFSRSKVSSAQNVPPPVFIGTVTVDGMPALPGTEISALIGGKEKGFARVNELGVYGPLYLRGSARDRQITFRVDNQMADQTVAGDKRRAIILDLTAESDDPS